MKPHPFTDRRRYGNFDQKSGLLYNKQLEYICLFKYNKMDEKHVYLSRLIVPEEHANKGYGTKIMTDFCKWLDANRFICVLSAIPLDHASLSDVKLRQFYRRFGFKWFKADDEMTRKP